MAFWQARLGAAFEEVLRHAPSVPIAPDGIYRVHFRDALLVPPHQHLIVTMRNQDPLEHAEHPRALQVLGLLGLPAKDTTYVPDGPLWGALRPSHLLARIAAARRELDRAQPVPVCRASMCRARATLLVRWQVDGHDIGSRCCSEHVEECKERLRNGSRAGRLVVSAIPETWIDDVRQLLDASRETPKTRAMTGASGGTGAGGTGAERAPPPPEHLHWSYGTGQNFSIEDIPDGGALPSFRSLGGIDVIVVEAADLHGSLSVPDSDSGWMIERVTADFDLQGWITLGSTQRPFSDVGPGLAELAGASAGPIFAPRRSTIVVTLPECQASPTKVFLFGRRLLLEAAADLELDRAENAAGLARK